MEKFIQMANNMPDGINCSAEVVHRVTVHLFDPSKYIPEPSQDDIIFSEDVLTIDENNLQGVAYYCFNSNRWRSHTDTLCNPEEIKWMWYYPPINAKMAGLVIESLQCSQLTGKLPDFNDKNVVKFIDMILDVALIGYNVKNMKCTGLIAVSYPDAGT